MYSYNPYYERYLAHHGVLGMHWGIRRYQPYTHGQKGIFKGLKKKKRADIKSLKKDLKAYKEAGDELAVAATKKAIKGVKKQYREDKRSVTEEFDKENLETYKNKIATEGTLEEVDRWKNKLSAEQLATATARLASQDAFNDMKNQKAWSKLENLSKKVSTIANLGKAGIGLLDQVNTLHNIYSDDGSVRKLSSEATAEGALKRQKMMSELPVSEIVSRNLANKKTIDALSKYQEKKFDADYGEKIVKAKTQEAKAADAWGDFKKKEYFRGKDVALDKLKTKQESESHAKEADRIKAQAKSDYDSAQGKNKANYESGMSEYKSLLNKAAGLRAAANNQRQIADSYKQSYDTLRRNISDLQIHNVTNRKIFDFSSVDIPKGTTVNQAKVSDLQKAYDAAYERSKSSGKSEAMSKANANRAIYALGRSSLKQLGDLYLTKDLKLEINKQYG